MIYVTGDTHKNFHRLTNGNFPECQGMTKDDYLIILGDFGGVWNKEEDGEEKFWFNWLEERPFTTLFIDGNHENFDRLLKYPEKEWHGGIVNEIRPSVLHLKRGYVFNIDGRKCFAFGGARSHDIQDGILEVGDDRIKKWRKDYSRMFRINHVSWWKEEEPSKEEMDLGIKTLEENNWNVDFVFTHECPTSDLFQLYHFLDKSGLPVESYELTNYLEEIKVKLNYKKWFFGHHHDNRAIDDKDLLLYEQIIRIN
jgi:hypothetical protein